MKISVIKNYVVLFGDFRVFLPVSKTMDGFKT